MRNVNPDVRQEWFLEWRMRQAAAVVLLGMAVAAPGEAGPCDAPEPLADSGAPSIVLLLDQSNSMRSSDPGMARYRAASHLLGRIQAEAPDAEAALIVFSDILHFDWRDDAYFQPAFPGNPGMQYESYVPFTRLAKAFPDGRTGLDTLRAYLETDAARPAHATCRRTGYLSDFPMACEAARAAFRNAAARPSRRMLVLITDGEVPSASTLGGDSAMAEFLRGAGLPATYVLGIGNGAADGAPASLRELAAGIAANGYSAANPRSAIFPVPAPLRLPALSFEDRFMADLRTPVPETAATPTAKDPGCPDSARVAAMLRAGNSLARVREPAVAAGGKHWLIAAPDGPAPSADWACCRVLRALPDPADSSRYIHVTLEAAHPFAFRSRVFSRLGEPVADAVFTMDTADFPSFPAPGSGHARRFDIYWDGYTAGGEAAATGAYVFAGEIRERGAGGATVTRALTRRVGILRER